jgi:hypothetical protein
VMNATNSRNDFMLQFIEHRRARMLKFVCFI